MNFVAVLCCFHLVGAALPGSFPTPLVISLLPALDSSRKLGFG
jgi:hypothetical protein